VLLLLLLLQLFYDASIIIDTSRRVWFPSNSTTESAPFSLYGPAGRFRALAYKIKRFPAVPRTHTHNSVFGGTTRTTCVYIYTNNAIIPSVRRRITRTVRVDYARFLAFTTGTGGRINNRRSDGRKTARALVRQRRPSLRKHAAKYRARAFSIHVTDRPTDRLRLRETPGFVPVQR